MFFLKTRTLICASFLALILVGCGGSTQGTGGVTVEGRLLEINGAPVNGALVTVVTSGDSATTDVNGAFVLGAEGEQIELLFESGETSAATAVTVTPQTRKIVATFKLDRERRRIETEGLEIEEDDDSRDDDHDPIEDDSDDDNGSDDDSTDDGDDSSDDDNGGDSDGDDEGESPGDDGNHGDGSGSGSSGGGEDLRREVRGTLEVISGMEVVVEGTRFAVLSTTEYRDENGFAVGAGYFSVGMEVKARGVVRAGSLIVERLEAED